MSAGTLKYFSPVTGFPNHKGTGIREVATRKANGSMKHVLEKQREQSSAKKWKLYTVFSVNNGAKLADMHSNTGTVHLQNKRIAIYLI